MSQGEHSRGDSKSIMISRRRSIDTSPMAKQRNDYQTWDAWNDLGTSNKMSMRELKVSDFAQSLKSVVQDLARSLEPRILARQRIRKLQKPRMVLLCSGSTCLLYRSLAVKCLTHGSSASPSSSPSTPPFYRSTSLYPLSLPSASLD